MAGNDNGNSSLLADFYVEFLGGLVPGLFVLTVTLIVLIPSLFVLCRAFYPATTLITSLDNLDVGLGAYGITGILLVVAYVLGSLFYRQDPKIPDWQSAKRVYRNLTEAERKRLAVQPTAPESAEIQMSDAQFPYFFLYEYLSGRGLEHLAKWVPWRGSDSNTWKFRTKMFINLLKIRINFLAHEKNREIVRNEAHVRMATSMWYATGWLRLISLSGISLILAAFLITALVKANSPFQAITLSTLAASSDHVLFTALAVDLLAGLLAYYIRRQVENFIHYLRVREIVYVLETAHFMSLNGYDLHPEEFIHQAGANGKTKKP